MADVIYLTSEGLNKLQNELKNLKEVRRLEIAERLKEAISFWDLSENSEYEEARNEQAQVEMRISEVEDQLKRVELIVEDATKKENKISIGMTVSIVNEETGEKGTYKIVGMTESDILSDTPRISNESPVWQALLGKKKGDSVTVKAPSGSYKYKVESFK